MAIVFIIASVITGFYVYLTVTDLYLLLRQLLEIVARKAMHTFYSIADNLPRIITYADASRGGLGGPLSASAAASATAAASTATHALPAVPAIFSCNSGLDLGIEYLASITLGLPDTTGTATRVLGWVLETKAARPMLPGLVPAEEGGDRAVIDACSHLRRCSRLITSVWLRLGSVSCG